MYYSTYIKKTILLWFNSPGTKLFFQLLKFVRFCSEMKAHTFSKLPFLFIRQEDKQYVLLSVLLYLTERMNIWLFNTRTLCWTQPWTASVVVVPLYILLSWCWKAFFSLLHAELIVSCLRHCPLITNVWENQSEFCHPHSLFKKRQTLQGSVSQYSSSCLICTGTNGFHRWNISTWVCGVK